MGPYISRDCTHAGTVSLKLMDASVTGGRGTPPTPSLPPITLAAEPNFRPALFLFLFLSLCFSVSLLLFSVYLPSSGLTNSVPTRINQTTVVKFYQLHRNIIDIDKKKTKQKKNTKQKNKTKNKKPNRTLIDFRGLCFIVSRFFTCLRKKLGW